MGTTPAKASQPKRILVFFKKLSREQNNIPIEKPKLYDFSMYLTIALETPQKYDYEWW